MPKQSSKRFHLVHVFGAVEPAVLGKSHRTYESLVKAAIKFIATDDYKEERDNVFYIVTEKRSLPRMGAFNGSDLDPESVEDR